MIDLLLGQGGVQESFRKKRACMGQGSAEAAAGPSRSIPAELKS